MQTHKFREAGVPIFN